MAENKEIAIQELEDGRDGYPEFISTETFNMAIEALEREPCEDAISRLEAIKIVNNPLNIKLDLMLLRLPSVNPIPPKVVVDTCTDAVSREEALKEMQKYHDDCAKTSEYTRLGFETAMNVIRELPPVTPERPKGEWVKGKDGYTRCTNCGSRGSAIKAHFCSHCGADMRGVSE